MASDETTSGGAVSVVENVPPARRRAPGIRERLLGTWPRKLFGFVVTAVATTVIGLLLTGVWNNIFASGGGFHAVILRPPEGPPDVAIREQPTISSRRAGTLAPGAGVIILCTASGDPVSGPTHGGGTLTSRLWDKVQPDGSSDAPGFVPDALVNTGTTKPEASAC